MRYLTGWTKAAGLAVSVGMWMVGAVGAMGQGVEAGWHLGKRGIRLEAAQELLEDRPAPAKVRVAVIDTGTEIDHPGLAGRIWMNQAEVPGNGLDDDGNGYVDDVHGWSFLCGPDADIHHDAYESARMARALEQELRERWAMPATPDSVQGWKASWAERAESADGVAAGVVALHDQWVEVSLEAAEGVQRLQEEAYAGQLMLDFIGRVEQSSGAAFDKKSLKAFRPDPGMEEALKEHMTMMLKFYEGAALKQEITEHVANVVPALERSGWDMDSLRLAVVGDGPGVVQPGFGCPRVEGPDAEHGTHVAGIIAGQPGADGRGKGIASHVEIMVIRAVPDGDERDEDIARAITYAVDHGARVINCSFGKSRSPGKHWVDEALMYAASNGVLIVHAAGNDARDCDVRPSYPSRTLADGLETRMSNWLEVGASSYRRGRRALADFSNYGATTVDLFAPGDEIYATLPDAAYGFNSGTSMAAPVVSGVAAWLWGYFPDLTANQMRDLLMASVRKPRRNVYLPGTRDRVPMTAVCLSGGMLDAEQAVEAALAREAARGPQVP